MDIQTLGDDAKAVLASHFLPLVPVTGHIRFRTPSRITPQAKAALDELVAAGAVSVEPDGATGLVYRPAVDCTPLAGWLATNPEKGCFRMVDTNGPAGTMHFSTLSAAPGLPIPGDIRARDMSPVGIDPRSLIPLLENSSLPDQTVARITREIAFLTDPDTSDALSCLDRDSVASFLAYTMERPSADWSSLGISDDGHLLVAWLNGGKMLTANFGTEVTWSLASGKGAGVKVGRMPALDFAAGIDALLA